MTTAKADVLTDVPAKPGGFWGDHTVCVGPSSPPAWLKKLVGGGLAHDICGTIAGIRMFARRRKYAGVVTDGGSSGIAFATLQALMPWGRKRHVMVDCLYSKSKNRFAFWLKKLRLKVAASTVERFVLWASHEVEDFSRELGLPREKLEYVPFHITLRDYVYEVRDDGYMFAGGNSDREYRYLVEAMAGLEIPGWIATTRTDLFEGVTIPPNVRIQPTNNAVFRQAIAGAKLVVLPLEPGTLRSGGQQTLLNAMYMGKPVIAVGERWAKDFITDGVDGLIVDYSDADALRKAMRWILDHPAEAKAMGRRAADKAANYTTKRTMERVYRLAKGGPPEVVLDPKPAARGEKRALLAARWPVGGIRTHLGYNYPTLAEAGYACTVVSPDDETLPPLKEMMPGAEFAPASANGLRRAIRDEVRRGRYSLVHAHGMTAAANSAAALVGSDVPLVVTLHGSLRKSQFRGMAGAAKRWLLSRALARAERVIVVSNDSRENALSFFPNLRRGGRVVVVPNGIDATRYEGGLSEMTLRDELGLAEDVTLIGYLGRFMPEKGFPLLIEAAARLLRFGGTRPFHVVAFGAGDFRREYEKRVEREGLAGTITLRDFVPDVAPVVKQMDLVVVPSLWEASSLVSMEAMAAGVPVLGSDCPGIREVLADTPARTVATGDVAALESGLRGALAGPWTDEARAFAPEARRRFDNRRSGRELADLYERVVG